jgi:cell division protease FtsH
VTFAAPESDRWNYREPEILARIKVALGGRAAEEVVFGETSTGAESDIQQLTEIARQMVGRWGMSSVIGPIAVIPRDGTGPFLPGVAEVSPDTQKLIDDEVRRIVDELHEEVVRLLRENRSKLDSLANALLEHETLDEEDAYAAAGVARTPTPIADTYAPAARSRT